MVYISYMSSVCRHTKDRKGEEGRRKRGRGEGREEEGSLLGTSWRTNFMSAKEIFVPNLKVEFGPPLQSLRCQVDICQNEEQKYQLKNLETLYSPALFPGVGLGMRLGLMSLIVPRGWSGNETRADEFLTNWMGPFCKFTIL